MSNILKLQAITDWLTASLTNVMTELWSSALDRFATKAALNAVVVGSQAAELFTFEVDTDTMELTVYSTAAYAEAFEVDENGYLCIEL
jgi:predicted secreted protein